MRLNRDIERIKTRKTEVDASLTQSVQDILTDIKMNGDAAVRKYAKQYDGFTMGSLRAGKEEIDAAIRRVDKDFLNTLQKAKERITDFHARQKQNAWAIYRDDGVIMGQLVRPLRRVGVYVPGGTAAYPSSVLMCALPAKLAGVEEIALFTPAKGDARGNGCVSDTVLAAAACCGITEIYKAGGAQAIGAAAYGTETISKVDKIVGPGNAYVAVAKRLVYGTVDIDMVAGPSEILIIADDTANPRYIAADLMSQAEHDPMAAAILITTSEQVIAETENEIDKQITTLNRRDIIEQSLRDYGAAVLVGNMDDAFALANDIAPEHLELLTENPLALLPKVRNAGSVFLGEYTPEPLGDYLSGPSHVLPTGGSAKFFSPLGVYDFFKYSAFSYYPREALATLREDVTRFAKQEGFDAHANAADVRFT
jgi:histidinol dehydrogenase